MSPADIVSGLLAALGVAFCCTGTLGVLRFPDLFTRLHALTKADNLGLGLLVTGLAVATESWTEIISLLMVWVVVMIASASSAHAVARAALRSGSRPWRGSSE